MGANGVSHQIVADDLEGIKAVLTWLAFVPPRLGGPLPALPTSDPADRPVTVSPAEGGLRTAQTVHSARGKSHQLAELLSSASEAVAAELAARSPSTVEGICSHPHVLLMLGAGERLRHLPHQPRSNGGK